MSEFMKSLVLSLVLVVGSMAPAAMAAESGNDVGNGGDVVICRDAGGRIRSIELLDYFEARTRWGMSVTLGTPGSAFEENVHTLISRLAIRNPDQERMLRMWWDSFMKESMFLPGVQLVDVPDSAHVAIPAGCAIEQVAIQSPPRFERDKRYTINKDLWDAMDNVNRAGLVFHELIYRHGIEAELRNSIPVRYYNALVASDQILNGTDRELGNVIWHLKFETMVARGLRVKMNGQTVFHQNGAIKDADLAEPLSYPYGGTLFKVHRMSWHDSGKVAGIDVQKAPLNIPGFNAKGVDALRFYENGALESVSKTNEYRNEGSVLRWQGKDIEVNGSVNFFPNGLVKSFYRRWYHSPTAIQVNGTELSLLSDVRIEVYESGMVKGVEQFSNDNSQQAMFSTPSGATVECSLRNDVAWKFWENGSVQECFGIVSLRGAFESPGFQFNRIEGQVALNFDGSLKEWGPRRDSAEGRYRIENQWLEGKFHFRDNFILDRAYVSNYSIFAIGSEQIRFAPGLLSFFSGKLVQGTLAAEAEFQVGGRKLKFLGGEFSCGSKKITSRISFGDSGEVKSGFLATQAELVISRNNDGIKNAKAIFQRGDEIWFYEDGTVERFERNNCPPDFGRR